MDKESNQADVEIGRTVHGKIHLCIIPAGANTYAEARSAILTVDQARLVLRRLNEACDSLLKDGSFSPP